MKNTLNNAKLVDLFRRASRLMARSHHRQEHPHHAQARALAIIRENGRVNQRDLLEMLDVRSSSLSEVLGKLERNGQIVRKKNEEDKRSFVISAVQEAQTPGEGPANISGKEAGGFFACLDEQERRQLGSILEKIVQASKDDTLCPDHQHEDRRHERGGRKQGPWRGSFRDFHSHERRDRALGGLGKFSAEYRGCHKLYGDDRVISEPKHSGEAGVE